MPQEDSLTILHKIGLSPTAARCYLFLAAQLPVARPTTHIAQDLVLRLTSVYRALDELTEKGFVTKVEIIGAASFRAELLTHALDNYAAHQRQLAMPLIRKQRQQTN